MLIRKVTIENFKQFAALDVDFAPFVCLVGSNNSGKTTLLQALALFEFCIHHCLSKKNGSNGDDDTLELKNRSIGPDEFFVLPVEDPLALWTDRIGVKERKQRVVRVSVVFDTGQQVAAEIKLNFNRFGISVDSPDLSPEWLQCLREFRISYLPVFSSFLVQEERRTPVAIQEELARGRVSNVIRNLLVDLRDKQREEKLEGVLRRAFPELKKMSIEFDEANDRYISVTYREQGKPKDFDLFSAGSGFQQFIYLFGFILLREPTVVLLDEPDVHLHAALQKTLLVELRRLVDAGKQVLFATHSGDLISAMEPENIRFLENGEARPLTVEFSRYDALSHLDSLDTAQLPKLQTFRRLLVVEGPTDYDFIAILCSKILGQSIWQQVDRRLAVCPAGGNPCNQPMGRLREQLQQMLPAQDEPLRMFVVADRDYHPDLDYLRSSKRAAHIEWHIWTRTEIENYLLSLEGMKRLVEGREAQQTLDAYAFEQEFHRLLESCRDGAQDRLVKAFQEYGRSKEKRWDPATLSQKSREFLSEHWEDEKLDLADAKGIVLPSLKRFLQSSLSKQFSNKALAESLYAEDIPAEVHEFARRLARFVGVVLDET